MRQVSFLSLILFSLIANATDYYWVGGSGLWSDYENHWATSSGGDTFHIKVPESTDNVIFDENSFNSINQTLTVDQTIVYCQNFDWKNVSNNPVFDLSENTLNVFGSFILSSSMSFDTLDSYINFRSSKSNNTIETAHQAIDADVKFDGENGIWYLTEEVNFDYVEIINGLLDANNNNLNISSLNIDSNSGDNIEVLNIENVELNVSSFSIYSNDSGIIKADNSTISLGVFGVSRIQGLFGRDNSFCKVTVDNPNNKSLSCLLGSKNSTFEKLEIKSSVYVDTPNSNIICDELSIKNGAVFDLNSSSVLVKKSLSSEETCSYINTIKSSNIIINRNGNIELLPLVNTQITRTAFENISILSDSNVDTSESYDLGNNEGITFNIGLSKDLYWVGGSGNWSDVTHWSTTSGGDSGSCIPGPNDNVYFDENSFVGNQDQVINDLSVIYCKDFSWESINTEPKFSFGDFKQMYVYGSFILNQNMSFDTTSSEVYFKSQQKSNISTTGIRLFTDFIFDGQGGEWTLLDDLNIYPNDIVAKNGILNTNDFTVEVESLLGQGNFVYNLSGSEIFLKRMNTDAIINSGTSVINMRYGPGSLSVNDGTDFYDINILEGFNNIIYLNSIISANKIEVFEGSELAVNKSITTNTLKLKPEAKIILKEGSITAINNELNIGGSCIKRCVVKSDNDGAQATIDFLGGIESVDNVLVQDINLISNTDIIPTNSVDLGNNSGWFFSDETGVDYYWVGDSGDWTDPNHWSLDSGGNPNGCIPSLADNAIFDNNSFESNGQEVIVNEDIYVNDIIWEQPFGQPKFKVTNPNTIYSNGSFTLSDNMILDTEFGRLHFISNKQENKIDFSGHAGFREVVFNNSNGSWYLLNSISTVSSFGEILFYAGDVTTNNHTLNTISIEIHPSSKLDLGASKVNVRKFENTSTYTIAGTSEVNIFNEQFSKGSFENISPIDFYDLSILGYNNIGEPVAAHSGGGFNNLVVESSTDLVCVSSSNKLSFSSIKVSSGTKLIVESGIDIDVYENLNAIGQSGFPVEILSSNSGVQTNINFGDNNICSEYLYLTGINAISTGDVVAGVGSDNVSNNSGWTFLTDYSCSGQEDEILSTEDFFNSENRIYPNPTTGELNISNQGEVKIQQVVVYSSFGTVVLNEDDLMGNKNLVVDLSSYSQGIYILKLIDENSHEAFHKIVKN